ncbi:androgen-dependent TFPI-regulating protein-like isoform X2 [Homarus americanus]|nr:androgen-dependent TFPI-regulating protein-like isoform X2 [Homarus americanus]XP_042239653.1 androgen-dependent TFPI-regulating protein-like isoform X2 [Homarus americanus]XP_042239661.1 androgen-dependent TFPI-regulating protein-like isoform X2 [Homarus americanus]XP_042239670.1 androgen-dependent TFPI-regulating protein-like isoform X2 [Homarus americanus]
MGALRTLFHLILALHYGYGINVYLYGLNPPQEIIALRKIGYGAFKYLTFWDMLLQFTYFTLAFVNDILGSCSITAKKQSALQKFCDFYFSTVVFAIGSFVSISFWGLYNINRDLIFPVVFDSWFPNWLNHNVHTTPLVGVLTELYLVPHTFPKRKTGLTVVTCLCLLYLIWVCFIAYQSGHWVYPILAALPLIERAVFISAMSVLISLFYIVGEVLNRNVWGVGVQQKKMK